MESNFSRDTLLQELNEKWLKDIENELNGFLKKDAQKLRAQLTLVSERLEKGEAEKAFNDLLQKLKPAEKEPENTDKNAEAAGAHIEWIQAIDDVTADLPAVVEFEQEEERFVGSEGDSFFIRINKFFKRAFRGYMTGLFNLGKKDAAVSATAWKQKVPVQGIVKYHFLDLGNWVENWNDQLRKLECDILLETEARILHNNDLFQKLKVDDNTEKEESGEADSIDPETIPVPNEEDIEIFFKKAVSHINDVLEGSEAALKELLGHLQAEITRAFSLSGTFEMNGEKYSDTQINKKENHLRQRSEKQFKNWRELKLALSNKLILSKEFVKLYEQVKERVGGFSDSISEFFDENMLNPLKKLSTKLEDAISLFKEKEGEGSSVNNIDEASSEKSELIREFIEAKLLRPIEEHTQEAELSTKLDRFTSAIQEWTSELPEKAILIEKLDLGDFPPKYEFEEVEWKTLVKRVLNNQITNVFVPKEIKPEEFLSQIHKDIKEIQQIVETNLEISGEVKKTDEEDPLEVAKEGLVRAESKLYGVIDRVTDRKAELIDKLITQQTVAFTKLARLLEEQDVSDVRMAGAEYKAKETAVDWQTKVQAVWARFVDKVELLYRFSHKKVRSYLVLIREFLGFKKDKKLESDKVDLATFLSETDKQIAKLPFIYRRLFDFKKEVDARFFIRRPNQFENFKKGYELWQNNFPSTFAVVGEKGSGKSLLINRVKEEILTKHDIIDVQFEGTVSEKEEVIKQIASALKISDIKNTKELIDAIHRKKKRVIVILENIQDCYIRNITGFEGIEELLYLISETNKEILWTVSSTRYGWFFLDKVLNISDYFTHAAESDNLSAEQIQELVMRRHNASGYDLKFLADESSKKSRSFRKSQDDEKKTQEYLRNTYFEKLAKLSEGNPSTAMIYWIRSIKEFDDTHFYINPFGFSSIDRIENLDSSDLFALAAFVLHDSLLPKDLAKIMHQPINESRLTVSRLASSSILVENNEGYMLNHLIYRQVIRVLKEANFIH